MANGISKHHTAIQYTPDKWLSTMMLLKKALDASLMHGRETLTEFCKIFQSWQGIYINVLFGPPVSKDNLLVFLYMGTKRGSNFTCHA